MQTLQEALHVSMQRSCGLLRFDGDIYGFHATKHAAE